MGRSAGQFLVKELWLYVEQIWRPRNNDTDTHRKVHMSSKEHLPCCVPVAAKPVHPKSWHKQACASQSASRCLNGRFQGRNQPFSRRAVYRDRFRTWHGAPWFSETAAATYLNSQSPRKSLTPPSTWWIFILQEGKMWRLLTHRCCRPRRPLMIVSATFTLLEGQGPLVTQPKTAHSSRSPLLYSVSKWGIPRAVWDYREESWWKRCATNIHRISTQNSRQWRRWGFAALCTPDAFVHRNSWSKLAKIAIYLRDNDIGSIGKNSKTRWLNGQPLKTEYIWPQSFTTKVWRLS